MGTVPFFRGSFAIRTHTSTGDYVAEEHHTVYNATGDSILTYAVSRHSWDLDTGETRGVLDVDGDSNRGVVRATDLKGRVSMQSTWYDSLHRPTDTVSSGTNSASDYDRPSFGSAHARGDTKLVTTTTYNIDGTVQQVQDPMAKVSYFEYDALGRKTKEVHNYDVSVNSGNPSGSADNQTIAYTYSNGLLTTMTAKMPSSGDDQVTTYTYGTVKGVSAGDSKIATGHLLQKVTYPDDAGGNRGYVLYAYNAQGQVLWQEDQATGVLEWVYDTAGRETVRKATTVASGFDSAVLRIERTYDGLSRPILVTQYDAASSGTLVDESKFTYDDWGPVSKFQIDRDSAVAPSAGNDYSVSSTFAKATAGRQTVRRTGVTMPSGKALTLTYAPSPYHDDELSRVSTVKDGALRLAAYSYKGVAEVVGTQHPEPDVNSNVFNATPSYPDLDLFGRITRSKWTKGAPANQDFYKVELVYDRNSNITWAEDKVHSGFDVKYTMDNLNRLTKAEEGTESSGSITSPKRTQDWTTLTQTGNWGRVKYDLNGDGDFVDTNEVDDTRTHTKANAIATQDTDSNSSVNYTLVHDLTGNLTDDNRNYKYEWDVFGRLRKVKNQSNALVAEYRYNGLGFRIAWHEDSDTDGDVDANDKWYFVMYDEAWRQLAVFRESDTAPKEEWIPQLAGLDGFGGSSRLDGVICRYKDANTAWTTASDGTLEERKYLLQNWRGDVSVLLDTAASPNEWVKYSAYGIPFALPAGDTDSDGDCDSTDTAQIQTWINGSAYDLRGDLDLDGDVDATDKTNATNNYSGTTLGWNVLTKSTVANRRGYAGYEKDVNIASTWHVRHRVLDSQLGRWLSRDPLGYVDGSSLYSYAAAAPLTNLDPEGTNMNLAGLPGHTPTLSIGGGGSAPRNPFLTGKNRQGKKKKKLQPDKISTRDELDHLPEIVGPATNKACCNSAHSQGTVSGSFSSNVVGFVACCASGNPAVVTQTPCARGVTGSIENSYAAALSKNATLIHEQKHIDLGHHSCDGKSDGDAAGSTPKYLADPFGAELEPTIAQLDKLKEYYNEIGFGYQLIETAFIGAQDYYKDNATKAGIPKTSWPPIVTEKLPVPPN